MPGAAGFRCLFLRPERVPRTRRRSSSSSADDVCLPKKTFLSVVHCHYRKGILAPW